MPDENATLDTTVSSLPQAAPAVPPQTFAPNAPAGQTVTPSVEREEAVILEIGREIARTGGAAARQSLKDRIVTWVKTGGITPGMKLKEKSAFFQMLSALIDAGIPILRALSALSDQVTNKQTKLLVEGIRKTIESGKQLSDGLEQYPRIFDEGQIGMVKSGEASGTLNTVLRDIARDLEQAAKLASQVKGALIYPTVIILTMFTVVFMLMVAVIPPITGLFLEAGLPLPMQTRILIAASAFAKNNWYLIVGFLVGLVGSVVLGIRTDVGRAFFHRILLHLPLFGALMKKVALSNFGRALANLLKSGVSIIRSLEIAGGAIGNEVYKRRILLMAEDVKSGIPIGENIKDSTFLFPPLVASMIAVGEQTAQLDVISRKIADYYQTEVEAAVKNLTKIIEPIVILFIGVVIGGIAFAVMEPLFSLTEFAGQAR